MVWQVCAVSGSRYHQESESMNNLELTIKDAGGSAAFDANKIYSAIAWDSSVKDRQGDKFEASTFDLGILDKHPLPLLFNHDSTKIAGAIVSAKVDGGKLLIDFRLADTELGNEMASLIAAEALNTLSVGFIARNTNGSVVRELVEVSLTPTPANANAVITTRSIENTLGDSQMSGPSIIKSNKEQTYSVNRFILGLSDPLLAKNAGFEFEISQEAARLAGKAAGTPIIPWGVLTKAAQDSITAPAGTPPTDLGQSLALPQVDNSLFTITTSALFKRNLAGACGVTTHNAPRTSEMKIPRLVASMQPTYIKRDTALPETNAAFDTISATPHTAGALVRINRSALLDTTPNMQDIVTSELRKAIDSLIDSTIISAVKDAVTPQGLRALLTGSAQDFGAVASAADLMAMIRELRMLDDSAKLTLLSGYGFINWATAKPVSAALTQQSLMSETGQIYANNDIRVVPTAKLDVDAAGAKVDLVDVILGDFSMAHLVAFGSGIELAVNPYGQTDWASGAVTARVITDLDFVATDVTRFKLAQVDLA